MPVEDTVKRAPRLTLKSQLDDMALLWPWVDEERLLRMGGGRSGPAMRADER